MVSLRRRLRFGAGLSRPAANVFALWSPVDPGGILAHVSNAPVPPPRPPLLSAALVLAWLMGLRTMHEGYLALRIIGNPLLGDALALSPELRQAFVDGILTNPAALPLAAAQLILGGFLFFMSVATLFAGARSVAFALQAVASNFALAIVGHVLGEPLHQSIATALLSSSEVTSQLPKELSPEQVHNAFRWGFRVLLGAQCALLLAIGWILSRPAARAFLAFSAAAKRES